jgi:glutamyl-tRNA synthetase
MILSCRVAISFKNPLTIDTEAVKPKWNEEKQLFFQELSNVLDAITVWDAVNIETAFKELALIKNIKVGELQLPFRVMLVGGKYGPAVFQIAEIIGKDETIQRCNDFKLSEG